MSDNRVKEEFTIQDGDFAGEYAVLSPSNKDVNDAGTEYNTAFAIALQKGALLQAALLKYMDKQGVWSKSDEEEYEELRQKVLDGELKIKKGGIKKTEGRAIAIEVRKSRARIITIGAKRNLEMQKTAEGIAETHRFNFLVSRCLVYNNSSKPVFDSLDQYLEHGHEPHAWQGAIVLSRMQNNLREDFEDSLPENQFLKKFGYIDNELRLVNEKGHLVDIDNRLIDESGNWVDEEGNIIDEDYNRVDEYGQLDIQSEPFLEDDGSPIVEEIDSEPETEPEAEAETPEEEPSLPKTKKKTTKRKRRQKAKPLTEEVVATSE
jgi:hypothetical protein